LLKEAISLKLEVRSRGARGALPMASRAVDDVHDVVNIGDSVTIDIAERGRSQSGSGRGYAAEGASQRPAPSRAKCRQLGVLRGNLRRDVLLLAEGPRPELVELQALRWQVSQNAILKLYTDAAHVNERIMAFFETPVVRAVERIEQPSTRQEIT
jgi:hypothetical protein